MLVEKLAVNYLEYIFLTAFEYVFLCIVINTPRKKATHKQRDFIDPAWIPSDSNGNVIIGHTTKEILCPIYLRYNLSLISNVCVYAIYQIKLSFCDIDIVFVIEPSVLSIVLKFHNMHFISGQKVRTVKTRTPMLIHLST